MTLQISRYYLKQFQAQAYISDVKVSPEMPETLGALIRRRMKDVGIANNSELARKIGVSSAYAGDLVNDSGKTKSGTYRPSPEVVEKLATTLAVSRTEILNTIGYLPEPNGSTINIEISEDVRLILLGKDVSSEDREEYERAVSLAVAMARQRIEEKRKAK